jgi:hypothetical protein
MRGLLLYLDPLLCIAAATQLLLVILGAIVTIYDQSARRYKVAAISAFALLGIVGVFATVIQSAKSTRDMVTANTSLASSMQDLQRSTSEVGRVTALNTNLQERLLSSSAMIAQLARQGINTATGGDSFAYAVISPFNETRDGGMVTVVQQGRYPLYDVDVRIIDLVEFQKKIANKQQLSLDDFSATVLHAGNFSSRSAKLLRQVRFSDTQKQDFNFFFDAKNGFWTEKLRYRLVGGVWKQALTVSRSDGKSERVMLTKVDDGYPTVAGQVEWGH